MGHSYSVHLHSIIESITCLTVNQSQGGVLNNGLHMAMREQLLNTKLISTLFHLKKHVYITTRVKLRHNIYLVRPLELYSKPLSAKENQCHHDLLNAKKVNANTTQQNSMISYQDIYLATYLHNFVVSRNCYLSNFRYIFLWGNFI